MHCVRLRSVQVLGLTSSVCQKKHLRNAYEAVGFIDCLGFLFVCFFKSIF